MNIDGSNESEFEIIHIAEQVIKQDNINIYIYFVILQCNSMDCLGTSHLAIRIVLQSVF